MTLSCSRSTTIFSDRSLRLSSSVPTRNNHISTSTTTVTTVSTITRLRVSTDHLFMLECAISEETFGREKDKGPVRVGGIDLPWLEVFQEHGLVRTKQVGEIRISDDRFDQLVHGLRFAVVLGLNRQNGFLNDVGYSVRRGTAAPRGDGDDRNLIANRLFDAKPMKFDARHGRKLERVEDWGPRKAVCRQPIEALERALDLAGTTRNRQRVPGVFLKRFLFDVESVQDCVRAPDAQTQVTGPEQHQQNRGGGHEIAPPKR